MDISKRIYELRKKKQVSQEDLANNLNVSRQAVSKWESNQTLPDLEKVVLMSEFFGVSTDYILTGKDKSGDYVLSTDQQMNKSWSAKKLGILVSLLHLLINVWIFRDDVFYLKMHWYLFYLYFLI